ncbi:MAG: hypothetical protein MUC35_05925 [Candidatus Margulisbacteria bacterium]|jgi:1-acyl-sn-glycerol-3-phosphate acyltransferase|nr:hypothetical protein [Candidatus Margulisiibacteriota bacterium]
MLHYFGKFWTRVLLWLTRITVKIEGEKNIPAGPVIYIQDPAEARDGMATLAYLPGKAHFIFSCRRLVIPLFGFLTLDPANLTVMHDDALAIIGKLEKKESVIFFTDKGEIKGGVTLIALETKLPVVPVKVKRQGKVVTIKIGKPLRAGNAADDHRHRQALKADLEKALA